MNEDAGDCSRSDSFDFGDKENDSSEGSELGPKYNYTFNVIVLGDSGVGKTDLIGSICDSRFKAKFVTTMGIDVTGHVMNIQGNEVKLQIWDPSGSEKYRHLIEKHISAADGVLYVYDVTYCKSFVSIPKWVELVHEQRGEGLPQLLIANKCDMEGKSVACEDGVKLSKSMNMPLVETSALDGINVDTIFPKLCDLMMRCHTAAT